MRTLANPTVIHIPHDDLVVGIAEGLTPENADNFPIGTVVEDSGQLWKAVMRETHIEWARVGRMVSERTQVRIGRAARWGLIAIGMGIAVGIIGLWLMIFSLAIGIAGITAGVALVIGGNVSVMVAGFCAYRSDDHDVAVVPHEVAKAYQR